MNNMNILWLSWKDITNPNAGGAEISGEQHAIAWVKAGHRVHWVSINYPGSTSITSKNGVEYEHIGKKWMWFLGLIHLFIFIKWMTKWHKEFDFVVDEIHGPPFLTPLYIKKEKVVIIHEVAGDIWKKTVPFPLSWIMQNLVEPLFFKAYQKVPIIAGAQTTVDDLIKIGIPKNNITLIPYGVTVPNGLKTYPKEIEPTIIFLSQLRPMKGFDRVYSAFKLIKKEISNCKLWVVGDHSLPYGQQVVNKVKSEECHNDITFYGKVSQEKKFELLQKATMLVHGSYKEGWGLVVIEANAVGTPAVVFDAAGLRNSVNNNSTGFVVSSEEDFVRGVTDLVSNQELYKQFQSNAKDWSNQFTWKNATEKSLSLLAASKNI